MTSRREILSSLDKKDEKDEKVKAVQAAVLSWYRQGHRNLPWRQTRDPYAILVAEVMLQQTQVDRVIPKYHQFLERYPTLEALAAAPRAAVIRTWAPLGYNLRAVRLHEIARQAVERYVGRLPDTVEGLRSLKGIGPYTAGAVACFAFGQAEAALDTNVRRVLGRIFGAEVPGAGSDDRLAWELAKAVLPVADAYDWNQALMDLGATVCLSRSPRCLLCPAQVHCSARVAWSAPLFDDASRTTSMVAEALAFYGPEAPGNGQPKAQAKAQANAQANAQPAAATKGAGRRGRHRTSTAERFEGSRRWYRGRIIDALRALPPGEALPLETLGQQVKPDFSPADRAWLLDLATALARDGLAELQERDGAISITLPS